jgi:MYXO-CTERM domain-containing protein
VRRLVSCVSVILVGLLAAPTPARACSCFVGPPAATTPAADGMHPANAGVVLWDLGCGADITAATATVDGAPATLELVVDAFQHALVAVTPTPTSGQAVELRGCINADGPCPDPEALLLAYTTVAADEQAPAAPGKLSFTVETGEVDVNCSITNALWTVTVDDLPPASREDPVVYTFAVTPGPGEPPLEVVQHLKIADSAEPFTVELFTGSKPFEGDAAAVCVRVTTSDMAGNAAAPLELCGEAAGESDGTPTGGQSDASSGDATAGTDEEKPEGCTCATDGADPRWALFGLMFGLGVRRRR